MHLRRITRAVAVATVGAVAAGLFAFGARVSGTEVSGTPRLIAFEPSPDVPGEACDWEVATLQASHLFGASSSRPEYQARAAAAPVADGQAERKPVRFIMDPYSSFSNVRLDYTHNEVVLLHANHNNIMVYDLLAPRDVRGLSARDGAGTVACARATTAWFSSSWLSHAPSTADARDADRAGMRRIRDVRPERSVRQHHSRQF